ncbi:MAG TPA: MYXO-CTERM sorting domain-containing protein, partial [Kofleriaceae bacterium]|nr:MYXO-CTERM sorting domain-containing protein [Kofleriaceae bacterium]
TAFAPRGRMQLAAVVAQDVPEISLVAAAAPAAGGGAGDKPVPRPKYRDEKPIKKGCDCSSSGNGNDLGVLLILGAVILAWRRR